MMKKLAMIGAALACLAAGTALAADHGYVKGTMDKDPESGIYPVNIEKINGEDASPRPNHEIPAGENTVTVSLMYDPAMGTHLQAVRDMLYEAKFELEVEEGKTYELAAKVDVSASPEEQAAGTFWKPIVVKVE